MARLVCIVEGKGEVQAIPNLCSRILKALSADQWHVDQEPIRRPRSQLVDESMKSPNRHCRKDGMRKALGIALARRPDAILVICDSDDDCPGVWASSVTKVAKSPKPLAAVMAVREFEGWLLWSQGGAELRRIRAADPERIRNAKGKLEQIVAGYAPATHQLALTRQIDVQRLRKFSRSFDKLVRTIGILCHVFVPPRPT